MALDSGGGAGDRPERFTYMQVDAMWAMLSFHDNAPHYQALEGWKRSYELVLMHRTQVEKYKEKLITAWPPERNKAARSYVERLDHLIDSLTETYEASITNYTAYSSALAAVDDIKRKMDLIQQEHSANTAALAEYDEDLKTRPRAFSKAGAPPPPPSPVAAGRQEELRLQAVSLMTGLTAELATAQTSLVAPRPYEPLRIVNDSSESVGNGGISPILPGTASFPARVTTSSRASRPRTPITAPQRDLTQSRPAQPSPSKTPSGGPILGGTKQPQAPSPNLPSSTPTTFTPTPNSTDPLNFAPSQNPSQSPIFPRSPATNNTGLGAVPPVTGSRGTASPLHGGVIGGTPPIGSSPSGRRGNMGGLTRGGQRINPIGGMIGQEGAVTPRRGGSSRKEDEARFLNWDPDNPWETNSGVDPVLSPPPEQKINPGPTIGGR
ncbi:hypothetical protein Aph02nite_54360 [Actinoplanes philippinensis]|nr:hypothetical protein Aph02nite_54360 [Actinoplanes philippinensis]